MVTVSRIQHQRKRATLRHALIALSILTGPVMLATPAAAQVSIGISIPGISIGINQPYYPELVPVPGSPVYYAPHAQTNYFFYDGLFWVYQDDRWYASTWYDGPWDLVDPYDVPLFVLRVPVRYYVYAPVYFHGWIVTAPPRWDIHWGPRWAQHRHGWDHWDYRAIPRPAPPPVYQRHYSGERYPRPEYQHGLRDQYYRYQPRDAAVRRHFQERPASRVAAPVQVTPPNRVETPRAQYPQRDGDGERRSAPAQGVPQQREPFTQQQRPQRQEPQKQESQRQEPQRQEPQRQEPERRVQPSQNGPVYAQPQSMPRPRDEMPRPAPAQVAPLPVPPQTRERAMPEQHNVVRQEAQRAQRDPGPHPMRQSEPQGRGNDQPRGNPERGHGQERGR